MKYLSVANYCFLDYPAGSPRVAWDIAKVMQKLGHDVTMFCQKVNVSDSTTCENEGIKLVKFKFPKTLSLDPFKLKKQISAVSKIAQQYLSDTEWDVIHIHVPIEGMAVKRVIGEGPKYIYTVHSPVVMEQEINWARQGLKGKIKNLFGRKKLLNLEGELLRYVNGIHTLSEFTKKSIDRFHGVRDKVTVIPHWCRTDFSRVHTKKQAREILGWPENGTILFTVRVMSIRYGLDVALKAAAPVLKSKENLYFVLAGEGVLKPALIDLAKELGVEDKVRFLGRVSDEVLKNCYEAADLFLLPTLALECFGLIVLEALSYGLPVISTDAAAIPELMEPILPDCIVPAASIEKLREKIEAFCEGRLSLPDSKVLQSYARDKYGQDNITRRLADLLENRM
ncbi:MAG: glycosyltransferase family 4 protein [Planctomycetota bacterium]